MLINISVEEALTRKEGEFFGYVKGLEKFLAPEIFRDLSREEILQLDRLISLMSVVGGSLMDEFEKQHSGLPKKKRTE